MNQINYEPIQLDLRKWMKERHLAIDSQKNNLLGNVMEELTEMVRANNDEEIIDALCDIMVFTTNASKHKIKTLYLDALPSIYLSQCMTSKEEFIIDIIDNIMFDTTDQVLLMCINNIKDLGYDPYLCMEQTIKEICSRSGHYDEDIGKFVKDLGFYTLEDAQLTYPNYKVFEETNRFRIDTGEEVYYRPKWYKANYAKCKK